MLRKYIIIFVVTVISAMLFWTNVNAQSQRPIPSAEILSSHKKSHTDNNKNNPQNDQRGTEQSPLVVKVAPSPNTKEEAAQAEKEKDERMAMERRSEITTRIIAGATIIQAIALIITIIVMIITTRRQLRAYVFLDTIDLGNVFGSPPPPVKGQTATPVGPWIFKPDRGPMTVIMIKNSGQTPAYNVVHTAYIGIYEYPNPVFPTPPESSFRTVLTIPPDGRTSKVVGMDHPLTPEEIDNLIKGTQAIYIYGTITYKTFGRWYSTNFRYMQNGFTATIGQTTIMTGCEEGNEAN